LRYETVRDEWTLHHGRTPDGWCSHDDAVHAREVESLLTEVERDADGRFRRLPARIWRVHVATVLPRGSDIERSSGSLGRSISPNARTRPMWTPWC
jgi:hypothetical protein